jgi:hypothetical protein
MLWQGCVNQLRNGPIDENWEPEDSNRLYLFKLLASDARPNDSLVRLRQTLMIVKTYNLTNCIFVIQCSLAEAVFNLNSKLEPTRLARISSLESLHSLR